MSTLLRDLLGTWVVGFNLGVEVALIEAISALYGTKEVMRFSRKLWVFGHECSLKREEKVESEAQSYPERE